MSRSILQSTLFLVAVLFSFFAEAQTYNDVKTIFLSKCSICHNSKSNEAPFSLESYKDVKKRLRTIKDVVSSNYMPPWLADPHYRDFANNRSLSASEKNALLKWIADGAVEGNSVPQKRNELPAQIIRKPDMIVKIDKAFIVKGDTREKFILFKVPFNLSEEKNIEGVEFFSNNKKIIHHVNYMFCDMPDSSVNINSGDDYIDDTESSGQSGQYERFSKHPVFYTGWIPGASKESYPGKFGWTLPKRGVVLFTVHYSAIAADENSVIGLNLYFKDEPAERKVRIISLGSGGIGEKEIYPFFIIPPDKLSTFSLKIKTPEDQSILFVWPHMHYLGKEFFAYAVSPTNDTINLVHIPQWNFNWQEMYKMKKLVKIPAGSTITIRGAYDNTAENPRNPFSPPRNVFSSANMISTDEMLTLLLIYVPYQQGDEDIEL